MNEEILKLAKALEAEFGFPWSLNMTEFERVYHATRAARDKELLAVVGEPDGLWIYKEHLMAWQEHDRESFDAHKSTKLEAYTKEQVAAAVLKERERCLNCYSPDDTATDYQDKIRSGV